MFGRQPATTIATVDAAFEQAEREVRALGQTVAARIATEFLAGRIGRQGVHQRVEFAIQQLRRLPPETVPTAMCERLESVLRDTIAAGLRAAGIHVGEAVAP